MYYCESLHQLDIRVDSVFLDYSIIYKAPIKFAYRFLCEHKFSFHLDISSIRIAVLLFFFFSFLFLGPHLWHLEVLTLGATAAGLRPSHSNMPDLSRVCNLHHSSL